MSNMSTIMYIHRCPICKTEHVWHDDEGVYKTITNSITYCKHCRFLIDPFDKPLIPLKNDLKHAESRLIGECPECDQLIDSGKNLHAMWCSKAEFIVTPYVTENSLYYKDQIR